jgi:hypothetical protein
VEPYRNDLLRFGKMLVKVPVPNNNRTVFCLFNVKSCIISQKVGLSFFATLLHFMSDPDSNSEPDPEP